jgi:hypothetical protein
MLSSAKPLLKKKNFFSSAGITELNPSVKTQLKTELATPNGYASSRKLIS